MRAVILPIWTGVACLTASLTAWAEVCHSPSRTFLGLSEIVITDVITKDVEVDSKRTDFNIYYHPWGEVTTEAFSRGARQSIKRDTGPVFEDCCNCGNNENAAYQLKIFSKQDPRTEKFDKPILVTQGFDANYKIPQSQFNFAMFETLLTRVFDKTDTRRRLPDETGLLRQLYEEGYDIALLLWKHPLISIQTNARVTLQALRWLERHTEIREGTEPVIIGPSMGGLVTRYALQLAGFDFPASGIRARLFIAFDSPNRGAEIPMSLQSTVSYLRDKVESELYNNLTSIAARQMLLSPVLDKDEGTVNQEIFNYEETRNCERDEGLACIHGTFMRDINNPAFRKGIKNIAHRFAGSEAPIYMAALINGSGDGMRVGLPEGATYLSMRHTTLDLDLGLASAGTFEEVLFANRAGKSALRYNFKEPAFIEDTPGGLRDTYKTIRKALEEKDYPWNETRNANVENHSFIPALSGAGLLNREINDEASWFRSIGIQGKCEVGDTCMFDEFRAPVSNQEHVIVTQENKQWFLELIRTHGPQEPPPLLRVKPSAGIVCFEEPRPGPIPPVFPIIARFGYDNPNTFSVTIPIGENNRFAGPQEDLGQPETFFPGDHCAFTLTRFWSAREDFPVFPAWTLDGTTVQPNTENVISCRGLPLCRPGTGNLRIHVQGD